MYIFVQEDNLIWGIVLCFVINLTLRMNVTRSSVHYVLILMIILSDTDIKGDLFKLIKFHVMIHALKVQ
jgi:hypothetical protein